MESCNKYLIFYLLKELLRATRSITDEVYIFQHDSSLSHRAYQTVELLCREKHKFTAYDMWLPNSPDIKAVDYCILASDAEASLPHADTGRGRAAAEGDELVGWVL